MSYRLCKHLFLDSKVIFTFQHVIQLVGTLVKIKRFPFCYMFKKDIICWSKKWHQVKRWNSQKVLLVNGILSVCFRAKVESTCSAESSVCHWATGLRGFDSMSAQCRNWFPVASHPRKIFPMASFLLTLSWSHTEITNWTLCADRVEGGNIYSQLKKGGEILSEINLIHCECVAVTIFP